MWLVFASQYVDTSPYTNGLHFIYTVCSAVFILNDLYVTGAKLRTGVSVQLRSEVEQTAATATSVSCVLITRRFCCMFYEETTIDRRLKLQLHLHH